VEARSQVDHSVASGALLRLSSAEPKVYRIGEIEIDLKRAALQRAGVAVELTPKSFAVLAYLVRNPGRLVPRKELLRQVWPSVLVGRGSLTQAIWEVRRALGDHSDSPRFIQTEYRRGYRFVASPEAD
jgi:DNA-binding winged helix-turn-helix (wHTH) protein